jgi:poly-gamma-glutamate capsule biosynthesis protein CapA/YwtB (metallophosphatase superfamily)
MIDRRARVTTFLLGALLAASACAGPSPVPLPSTAAPAAATPPATTSLLAESAVGATTAPPPVPVAASPEPTPQPPSPVLVPLVPVTGPWSTERTISRRALAAAFAGRGAHPRQVFIPQADLAPLAAALRVTAGPNVRALSPPRIRAALAKEPSALGILRAEDVAPDVRALAIGGVALFGEKRVHALAAWPLLVAEPPGVAASTFDPTSLWTLAAGGDVMLDREVYRLAVTEGRGVDYPWTGGTAQITGSICCGAPGQAIVDGRRTGHAGAVRALLRDADVALVNLEGPAPDDHRYHPDGYVFTMDPALLAGLNGAGIDVVSLANNHIRNAGADGVADTIRNLDAVAIGHAGAGGTAKAARRPAWLAAAGQRIAVLAYNGVDPGRNATGTTAGAAPLALAAFRADIRAARRAGADVVIVVPHWGREYTDAVTADQRRLAIALVAAGADAVLGSHSHWAGPLELVDGRLVVYSLGDLVFDLRHDARTQQGVIAELTFAGTRLAQVDLHPTLIVDRSQPNLLEPAGGGDALLRAIAAGSARLGRAPVP